MLNVKVCFSLFDQTTLHFFRFSFQCNDATTPDDSADGLVRLRYKNHLVRVWENIVSLLTSFCRHKHGSLKISGGLSLANVLTLSLIVTSGVKATTIPFTGLN